MTNPTGPAPAAERVVFTHASVLNERQRLDPDQTVVVQDSVIESVGQAAPADSPPGTRVVDVGGRVLMPGLIDAHVHALAYTPDIGPGGEHSPFYVAARAAEILGGMLDRGFTTVRDCAGADHGLAQAVDEGYIRGPRVFFGGKGLSQTGGHGDHRPAGRDAFDRDYCRPTHCTVVDGVDAVRLAVRDELRRGAHHIKLMLGGGIASPTDRIDSTQFSVAEIEAAVEEARAAGRYVTGHAYTAAAINRGLRAGVRCIEHGNLLDESSIDLFRELGAFYVPTLVTYQALADQGRELGLPEVSHRKVFDVLESGLEALRLADRAGVDIVYGTDLLGEMHYRQLEEFTIRAQVQTPAAIIAAATTTAARLLGVPGRIGVVAPGAEADLLVVDGNPLADIRVLTDPGKNLRVIMRAGRLHRNDLPLRDEPAGP